jgi:antitoxin MazE
MRTNIIRIGNSQGIRIPKIMLEQSHLEKEVELEVKEQRIIIRSATKTREGWAEKFQQMAKNGDDSLLDKDLIDQSRWDKDEWVW